MLFFLCLRQLASVHAFDGDTCRIGRKGVGTEAEKQQAAGGGGPDTCFDVGWGRALCFCATRRARLIVVLLILICTFTRWYTPTVRIIVSMIYKSTNVVLLWKKNYIIVDKYSWYDRANMVYAWPPREGPVHNKPRIVGLVHTDTGTTVIRLVTRDKSSHETKDSNGVVLGRISADFGSCGFRFGDDFLPTVFGFGAPKLIGFGFGFGFPPMDIQWISEINHLELKLMFYNMLIITYLLILLNLF